MKKKAILLTVVILFSTGPPALAQEGGISGTVDLTYMSKYIWRGFDIYGNDDGIQLGTNINISDTGFGLKTLWSRANGSGFENLEEFDITLYYNNLVYEDETYATNYTLGWTYYGYPDEPSSLRNYQEFLLSLAWPKICPAGFVPSYTIVYMWPAEEGSVQNDNGGWLHILGIGYDLKVPELVPELPEQVLHLSGSLIYNGGVGAAYAPNGSVDHDWSHFLFGASTDFDLGNNLAFCPALYYQASMEDSVNSSDETWVSLSLKYKF
ncbi:MAG: hypothetical protein OEW48_16700 [Phycisphaerae bacterium]|nr:hypothetical protein [Phycisphaerae bacterium]